MNAADFMKVLDANAAKRRELNNTSKWTDKELCEKIVAAMDKRLGNVQKGTSYGEYLDGGEYIGWTFSAIKTFLDRFDENPRDNAETILGYSVNIFLSEICNFCPCGCNAKLLRYILKFLECFNYDGEGKTLSKDLFDKEFSHPLMSDSDMWVSYEFLAKWVDSIGLSDHGTSVYSSWLTDEGLTWREVLRRVCKEEK